MSDKTNKTVERSESSNLNPVYFQHEPVALFGNESHLQIVREQRSAREVSHHFKSFDGTDITINLDSERTVKEGKEYKYSDGTVELSRKDGSIKIQYKNGDVIEGRMNKDGSWTDKHFDPQGHLTTIRTEFADGKIKTTNADGSEGYIKYPANKGGNHAVHLDSWGPSAPIPELLGGGDSNNYHAIWRNYHETRIYKDGTSSTVRR